MSSQPPPPPPMQQTYTPQYQPEPPRPGPGRKWYVIDLLLFLLFFVPSLLAFLNGLDGITNGLIRVPVPGETSVELEEGDWTIFYEHAGEYEGDLFNTSSDAPLMNVSVTGEDGQQAEVGASTGSFDYNIGGRAGYSIGDFEIDEAGTYTIVTSVSDPADTDRYLLALGKDLGTSTAALVIGIIGMIGSTFVAFVVWLVVIIMRSRAKKRMQTAGYAG
jgi:hypothetical protein